MARPKPSFSLIRLKRPPLQTTRGVGFRAFLAGLRGLSLLGLCLAIATSGADSSATPHSPDLAAPSPDQRAEYLVSKGLYTDRIFLQGLDKVTGRVFKIEAKIGEEIQFQKLRITVRQCRKTPPEEPAESLAFLEIFEERRDDRSVPVFGGWMFASNPAISGLEHPVYDVWVHECTGATQEHPPLEVPSVRTLNTSSEGLSAKGLDTSSNPGSAQEKSDKEESLFFEEGGTGDLDGPLSLPESLEEQETINDDQIDAFYKGLNRPPPMEY